MAPSRTPRCGYLAIIFWVGFAALIYQIYSVEVLFVFFVRTTHAVALAVSSFLAGLAFSSLLFSRHTHHNLRSKHIVCGMALAAGAYGYLVLPHYEWIPLWTDMMRHSFEHTPMLANLCSYGIMWIYLFFPAFFLGGAFPLINGLYLAGGDDSARDTGTVYFWDTLGAIAGALVAGFVLLPELGLKPTAMIAAAINLLIAMQLMPTRRQSLMLALMLAGLLSWETYRFAHPETHFLTSDAGHIIPVRVEDIDTRYGDILFQKESPYGRITVGEVGTSKTLFINYRTMCQTDATSEIGLATGTMASAHAGSNVLNIGLGCGFTASRLAQDAHTKHLDVVEINPVIPQAAALFSAETHDVLHARNMTLHLMDGAQWLRTTAQRYHAIVIDVEEVSVIYSSPLYTREYFAIIRDRLMPGGVFSLWSFRVNPQFTQVMYNTLKSVFPYVEMRAVDDSSIHYFAAMHPLHLPKSAINIAPVLAQPIDAINSIEDRELERYYNSNRNFSLPDYYRESFVRTAPKNSEAR